MTESVEPASDARAVERRVETVAAILLSIATVVTAWSAYQATRWSGVQAEAYTTASASRTESVRASALADRQILIDVSVLLDWIDATRAEDDERAADLESRMREEFRPAFQAWLATAPPGTVPEGTPFTFPEYSLVAEEESARLEEQAAASFQEGQEANETSDNFVLAAVLFASVLFFAGLGGTFDSLRVQVALLVMGGPMLAGGAVVVFSLPQNVGL